MKFKLLIVGLALVLALSLVACSTDQPGTVTLEVPIDNFMSQPHQTDQIEVAVGDVLTLILGSNPTTGYSWSEEAQISEAGILKQTSHDFIGPDSDPPPPPGTPGQEVWTFEALAEGSTDISLEYGRPWEGGEKAEWTYTLTVTVK